MPYVLAYADTGEEIPCGQPEHMTTARRTAKALAFDKDRAIQISRIGKGGIMRATLVVNPDGTTSRPPGTKPAHERSDHKADGPCFCPACRAERRARRAGRAILAVFAIVYALAGGQDRAQAFEWNHIGPDWCSTITTLENPIECRDQEGDTSDGHGGYGSADDHRAIRRGRERQQEAESYADRTFKRWHRQECERDRLAYLLHHPFVKPLALRGLSGCELYAADAAYHSEARPGGLAGLALSLIG